jgi:hypothetical protein
MILCDLKVTEIKQSTINDIMKEHIISSTLAYLEVDSDLNNVSRRVTNNLNAKYGGSWICLIGKNLGDVHFEYEDFQIWFQHNTIQFMVFKAKTVFPIDYSNVIIEARKPGANVTVMRNNYSIFANDAIVGVVKSAVYHLNNLESICQNITSYLENVFKNKYFCGIGTFVDIEKIPNVENNSIFMMRIESLNFTFFHWKNLSLIQVIVENFHK